MPRPVLIALVPVLMLQAQGPPDLDECLDAIARTASTFAATAPGLMAEETLEQRGRRGFIEILRGRRDEIKNLEIKLPQDFQTHQVISSYALAETGEPRALHEVRTPVSIDGQSRTTGGLGSPDHRTRRERLEDPEFDQLEGGVTDFGQLILLFTKRLQKDYAFFLSGERLSGDEPVVVLGYRQISGAQGLTFFKERTEERLRATGEIWFRQRDLLPVRIVMNTEEPISKKFGIRTEAAVDYIPSPFGLVPEHVIHKQFLNAGPAKLSLMVENDLHYADFHHANPMIP